MRNNRGFTLVELIAVVVLLSLVLGIAGVGIGSVIKNSKDKNEEIFVKKLEDVIDGYIDLSGSNFEKEDGLYTFNKCMYREEDGNCKSEYSSDVFELEGFSISKLVSEGYLNFEDLVNPVNSKNCFEGDNYPFVRVFRDDEHVYYYYVDLTGDNTNCDISDKSGIINNLPDDLYNVIKAKGDIE